MMLECRPRRLVCVIKSLIEPISIERILSARASCLKPRFALSGLERCAPRLDATAKVKPSGTPGPPQPRPRRTAGCPRARAQRAVLQRYSPPPAPQASAAGRLHPSTNFHRCPRPQARHWSAHRGNARNVAFYSAMLGAHSCSDGHVGSGPSTMPRTPSNCLGLPEEGTWL